VTSPSEAKAAAVERPFSYVLAARLAIVLYAACFLAGIVYVWSTRRTLPSTGLGAISRAQELEGRGDLKGALREFRMLASLQRRNYDFAKKVAELARATGDPSADIEKYVRAREIWPRDPAVRVSLGTAYAGAGRHRDALESFRAALELKPGDRDAMTGVGDALVELQLYEQAAAAYEQAIRVHPSDAALRNRLGIAFAVWGRPADAIVHFESALRLSPDPQFQANLERARQEAAAKS
jgi:tetratricopeptide (TPR) repeat protein